METRCHRTLNEKGRWFRWDANIGKRDYVMGSRSCFGSGKGKLPGIAPAATREDRDKRRANHVLEFDIHSNYLLRSTCPIHRGCIAHW
jgi:hypothetical protein